MDRGNARERFPRQLLAHNCNLSLLLQLLIYFLGYVFSYESFLFFE